MSRAWWLVALSACAPVVLGTYPGDVRMWNELVAQAEPFELHAPLAAVAPHHLIDGPELAGFWSALSHRKPSTVLLLAPDHFARGLGVTVGQRVSWQTTFGRLHADAVFGAALGHARDVAFEGEHSVHVHAPFVRRFLPDARFVPVLLQWGTPRAELDALVTALDATLPADTLIVASVDFSHYQPEPWATFHDEASHSSVTGFDFDGVFEREVDSPESLYVTMKLAQVRGAGRATRVLHTNSQRRRVPLLMDSTSHQYFVFESGVPAPKPTINVTITGDVERTTQLGVVGPWRWTGSADAGSPQAAELINIRGREDRFFMGADATLFAVEPGQVVERNVRGAGLRIIGVDASAAPTQVTPAACVVVVATKTKDAPVDLHAWLAAGAHAVIGRGFGARQPVELLGAGVVAPSLGPFIGGDGAGEVLGLTCAADGVRVRSVPIIVRAGVPSLDALALEEARGR